MHGKRKEERRNLRRAQFTDAQTGEPLTHIDGRLERLALDDGGDETARERVSVAVELRLAFFDLGRIEMG